MNSVNVDRHGPEGGCDGIQNIQFVLPRPSARVISVRNWRVRFFAVAFCCIVQTLGCLPQQKTQKQDAIAMHSDSSRGAYHWDKASDGVLNDYNMHDGTIYFLQTASPAAVTIKSSNNINTDDAPPGNGWNTVTSEIRGDCVSGTLAPSLPAGTGAGQKVDYRLQQISSWDSLSRSLGLDVGASLGIGIFSSDARYRYFSSTSFHRYSNYLFVSVEVLNQTRRLKNPTLTEFAMEKLQDNTFVDACGDEFIVALKTGGSFTAIVEFEASSESEQKSVSMSLNAAIGGFVGGKVGFQKALEKLSASRRTQITVLTKGGADNIPNMSSLQEAALAFPGKVSAETGNPWIVGAVTSDYDVVRGFTGAAPSLENQRRHLGQLAQIRLQLIWARNSFSYAKVHASEFSPEDIKGFDAALKAINEKIESLDDAVAECTQNFSSGCEQSTDSFRLTEGLEPPTRFNPVQIVSVPAEDSLDTLKTNGKGGRVRAVASCPGTNPKLVQCTGWLINGGLHGLDKPNGKIVRLSACPFLDPRCMWLKSPDPFGSGFYQENLGLTLKEIGEHHCAVNVNVPASKDTRPEIMDGPFAKASVTAVCSN